MSQVIKTISRDAGNTSKGYTLQKLRAISLILDELAKDGEIDFVAAIEYNGDVYVADEYYSYVEENKDYASKNFSFASSPIKNTMVYFLDHWLNNKRDGKIKFGIFATNNIAKEINNGTVKDLNIELPKEKIIESLHKRDYSDALTLSAAKILILSEYKRQYESNKNVKLEQSYFSVLSSFSDQDWKDFFGTIFWTFTDTSLEVLEKEILDKINTTTLVDSARISYKAPFIRAELFYQLELRQTKNKTEDRLLNRTQVENIFYKAINGQIDEGSYKYLNIDYAKIQSKTQVLLKEFIDRKYFAISGIRKSPALLQREVLLLDGNIKFDSASADDYSRLKQHGINGAFSNLVQTNKPIFLFGELGSGKSSIAAQYMLDLINRQPEIVPIFIPSNYLQQKNIGTLAELKKAINNYVNEEMQIEDHVFDLDTLFKTKKESILILDGIDEFDLKVARQLIALLKSLKQDNDFLRIIATGRPVELEGLVPAGWQTLSIVPLTDNDILSVLYNEALNRDYSPEQSDEDNKNRLVFLKSRPELHAISTTPLIICSIRDSLDASIADKTLGDILYNTLKNKLTWNSNDNKSGEYTSFAEAYPSNFSKEPLLAALAWKIFSSKNKSLSEDELNTAIVLLIPESVDKPKIVAQATKFFKNNFLEKSTGNTFAFISAPMLECATGLFLVDKLKLSDFEPDIAEQWRCLSFALAIARKKGVSGDVEQAVGKILKTNLTWPRNFVAQLAILLAEYKSEKICEEYFDMINTLEFRPFRIQYENDVISTNAYASCMILAKEKGFNWFWDNYLNLKNPLIHYEGKLAADILTQYFLLQNFKINHTEKQRLESLIFPNLSFPSSFCFELLPVIATITDKFLTTKERYQLLASCLSKVGLKEKAREILVQEFKTAREEVLAALETISNLRDDKEVKPAELWLEINSDRKISNAIIGSILKSINIENFNDYKKKLNTFVKEDDLRAFLKYCVLSQNEFAQSAALFLFMDGEQEFKLIGNSLLKSIDWLDSKNYAMVEQIVDFVRKQDISHITSIINQVPVDNHLGIPPAYWRVFLTALELSDDTYEEQFMKALRHMSLYTLTRYPEIRLAFSSVLRSKIRYQEAVRSAMVGLDTQLRYLSASLLLTINPGDEYDALEAVIYGIRNGSDMSEWETFCLGLHYSPETLQKLHGQVSSFNGIAKIYALLLLKRNQQSLSSGEIEELIEGLLSEGYFLDRQGWGFNSKYNIILSQPEYISDLINHLDGNNITLAQRAADILYQYHLSSVDDWRKPKIYMLYCEKYERAFFEFTIDSRVNLSDESLVNQMEKDAHLFKEKHGKDPLLWLYCNALKSKAGYDSLLRRLIQKNGASFGYEWDALYSWLLNITRRHPELKVEIGKAVHELFLIPAICESDSDNFAWLKLMENEFDPGSDYNGDQLTQLFPRTAEELYISLYYRNVYKIDLATISPNRPAFHPVFANYHSSYIEEVSTTDLERYFFSAEQIPSELDSKMLNILLFGNFSPAELDIIENKGELASYFTTVIKFCRSQTVNTGLFSISSDIGSSNISQRILTEFHRNILFGIYQILLSQEACEKDFIAGLVVHLEDENDENYVRHFQQLLTFDYCFKKEDVIKLFAFLDDKPYLLKPGLALSISNYLSNKLKEEDKEYYIANFKKFLRANRSQFNKYDADPQRNTLSWILSLAVLFLEAKISDESKFGFLLGLQSCFLEKTSLQRNLINKLDYHFEAGALLKMTNSLLAKVEPGLIREICMYGADNNIPEVRATCYVLLALAREI